MARKHAQVVDSEVEFPADVQLVTTTDLRGVITYANPAFCRIAGYQVDELVGHNHNLVRHPDMPKAAFADLWDRLKEGNPWRGMVKNRCKDGRYYWVDAYVTPIYENGKISGYQSVRCKPEPQLKQVAAQAYQALLKAEQGGASKLPSLHSARPLLLGLLMLALFGWAAFSQGALTVLLMLLPLLAVAGAYWRELISLPRYLKRLGQQYDSLTRLVYSGDAPGAIADFHLKMLQARIRTVLGRVNDATHPLQTLATDLQDDADTLLRRLFRQLASALHPDREPDPAQRDRKTALMAEANRAHAGGDLPTLLRLQQQVLQAQPASGWDDARLTGLLVVLRRQVADLERERAAAQQSLAWEAGLPPESAISEDALALARQGAVEALAQALEEARDTLKQAGTPGGLRRWLRD